jgi:hypothetical protein
MLETDNEVVDIPDHDHVAHGLSPSPAFGPEIEDVVEVDVREQWRNHRALARPPFLSRHDPVFEGRPLESVRKFISSDKASLTLLCPRKSSSLVMSKKEQQLALHAGPVPPLRFGDLMVMALWLS